MYGPVEPEAVPGYTHPGPGPTPVPNRPMHVDEALETLKYYQVNPDPIRKFELFPQREPGTENNKYYFYSDMHIIVE